MSIHFSDSDLIYDLAKVSIVTDLEMCMGIIVACSPMFPPTFERIFRGKTQSDLRNHISSTVARIRFKGLNPIAVKRIDDLYPLTDFEGSGAQNEITGLDSKPNSFIDDHAISLELEAHPHCIKTKTGWDVRSDKAV